MKKALSIILAVLLVPILSSALVFNAVRSNVSYSTLLNLAMKTFEPVSSAKIEQDGLFYPEEKQLKLAAYGDIDLDLDLNSVNYTAIVQGLLDENGIDIQVTDEVIKEVLNDPYTKKFLSRFADEASNYVLGKTEIFDVSPEELKGLIENSLAVYEKTTGEKVDYTIDYDKLDEGLSVGIENFNEGLDEIREENAEVVKILNIFFEFFSVRTLVIYIIVILLFVALIILINKSVMKGLPYICIPTIISGVGVTIGGLFGGLAASIIDTLLADVLPSLVPAISELIKDIFKSLEISGITTILVAGIILCVAGFVKTKMVKEVE